MTPEKLLSIVRNIAGECVRKEAPQAVFRLAKIDPAYSSGLPRLQFDGESAVTTKTYPHDNAYTPAANDRVLVAILSNSEVILCKIKNS